MTEIFNRLQIPLESKAQVGNIINMVNKEEKVTKQFIITRVVIEDGKRFAYLEPVLHELNKKIVN
jgi:hypothetical protein